MKYLALFLMLVLPTAVRAQTVNGNSDAAFAVGKWKESHEGVSLFCVRVTTQEDVLKGESSGACFLTEAQASAKDSVTMSTNTFAVTTWDEHSLTATTEFYADKNGDQTSKSSPGATKFVYHLILNFETHQLTKIVEAGPGNSHAYLKGVPVGCRGSSPHLPGISVPPIWNAFQIITNLGDPQIFAVKLS